MPTVLDTIALPLFVPADRPDRFGKAFGAGADAVIIDLEDAVAVAAKEAARRTLAEARDALAAAPCPVLIRLNARHSPFYEADLTVARALPGLAGVVLPKAEAPHDVAGLAEVTGRPVLALVESARGLAAARAIADTGARLAFGSYDFAADVGCAPVPDALLFARSELVLACRLAGGAPPLDGITPAIHDEAAIAEDARTALRLGMGGKLLIHPAQIAPARAGLRPTADELAWADRVLTTPDGAAALDGTMVDAPLRLRAEQVRRRAAVMRDTSRPDTDTV